MLPPVDDEHGEAATGSAGPGAVPGVEGPPDPVRAVLAWVWIGGLLALVGLIAGLFMVFMKREITCPDGTSFSAGDHRLHVLDAPSGRFGGGGRGAFVDRWHLGLSGGHGCRGYRQQAHSAAHVTAPAAGRAVPARDSAAFGGASLVARYEVTSPTLMRPCRVLCEVDARALRPSSARRAVSDVEINGEPIFDLTRSVPELAAVRGHLEARQWRDASQNPGRDPQTR